MIRIISCVFGVSILAGCAVAQKPAPVSEAPTYTKTHQPVTVNRTGQRSLTIRPDFARNIPQLLSYLDPAQPDRNGTKQYLQDTPEVRKLLQIDSSAIVARDRPGTRGHISLTRDVEYKIDAYTKQCIGFIKAVITDPNWSTRNIKGDKRTLSRTNLPPKYSVIGYFAGGIGRREVIWQSTWEPTKKALSCWTKTTMVKDRWQCEKFVGNLQKESLLYSAESIIGS